MADEDLIAEPVDVEAGDVDTAEQQGISPEQTLAALLSRPNLASDIPAEKLADIGAKVCDEYEIDCKSRDEWLKRGAEALKLASLVSEQKDYPFDNAANVKYPLLTTAALQFNARAYPAIVQSDRVVKCKTWGNDPDGTKAARGERVSQHMSYQLMAEMPEWEEDTDRLLMILPIAGCVFRKEYYDSALRRNVSRLVTADRLVVNYWARSMEDAPRITEKLFLYPFEIEERIRDGRYVEFEYTDMAGNGADTDEAGKPGAADPHDPDGQQTLLEQHRLLDLDEDGYPEPYVVTVHEASQKVVRVMPNFSAETVSIMDDGRIGAIRRQNWFTKYDFFPNPDGGFYGWGLGFLLKDVSEAINTTLNQMLDAGHLTNVQGGIISAAAGIREKDIRLEMGEWRVLNTTGPLSQSVMPITYPGPSAVLFQLLGLLIEAGKEVANVKDVLTGETKSNQTATATMALIEQGLQVFTAIYKRIHRALKAEFGILARLNRQHLSPEAYNGFLDGGDQFDPRADYAQDDMDIQPVSDPQSVTKMQKLAKAQMIMESGAGNPMINQEEMFRRLYEAAGVEDIDKLFVQPPEPDPAEQAFMEAVKKLGLQEQVAAINNKIADTLKKIADAEAAEEGTQMSYYDMVMRALTAEHSMEMDVNGQGGLSGMEGPAGDPMGNPAPGAPGEVGLGGAPSPIAPTGGEPAGNMGAVAAPVSAPQGAL